MPDAPDPTADSPLVTIGIPVRNGGPFIRASVESALGQTWPNLEVLVVDNDSSDDTVAVASAIDDSRVSVVANGRDLGMAGNHNRIIELANGEFIKILHADDVLEPDCVRRQVEALIANPKAVIATSRRQIIDDSGKPVLVRGPRWKEGPVDGRDAMHRIARAGANLIGEPPAVLMRADAARAAGGFLPDAVLVIDIEFWSRMLVLGDLYFMPDPLAHYRVRKGNTTQGAAGGSMTDFEALWRSLAVNPEFEISHADVERGLRRARRDLVLRRWFVTVMSVPATHRERLAFLIVGSGNTAFGLVVFAVIWALAGAIWPAWLVIGVSYAISMTVGYFTQRTLVFRSRGSRVVEFPKFVAIYAGLALVNMVAFPLLRNALGMNPYVAQFIFVGVVVVLSYLGGKYFTFREQAV